MKVGETARGFSRIEFADYNGEMCSLQKSSLATEDCIWLGVEEEYLSDSFVVYVYGSETRNWFDRLSDSQKDEIAALLAPVANDPCGTSPDTMVAKDWIEEHGGQRCWWDAIFAYRRVI